VQTPGLDIPINYELVETVFAEESCLVCFKNLAHACNLNYQVESASPSYIQCLHESLNGVQPLNSSYYAFQIGVRCSYVLTVR
jgi:hypothetical protein